MHGTWPRSMQTLDLVQVMRQILSKKRSAGAILILLGMPVIVVVGSDCVHRQLTKLSVSGSRL